MEKGGLGEGEEGGEDAGEAAGDVGVDGDGEEGEGELGEEGQRRPHQLLARPRLLPHAPRSAHCQTTPASNHFPLSAEEADP